MRQQNISQRLCGWNAQKRKGYFFIDYAGVVVFGKAFFVCKVANRAGTCASRAKRRVERPKKKRVLFYRLCGRYRVWRGIYYLLSRQQGRHMRQQNQKAGGTPKSSILHLIKTLYLSFYQPDG